MLTETYDPVTECVVTWGYANRNQAKGVDGKCVGHLVRARTGLPTEAELRAQLRP